MLTPQDIKEKTFGKAAFGGYDMGLVDDFLERLTEDYAALYKENAVLKSKLKVLVEKVEEYRSTEDSMRMALVTAQKMGGEIVEQAKAKGDAMLAEVNEIAKKRSMELKRKLDTEEARLAAAERKTEEFSRKVLDLIAEETSFIQRLGEFQPTHAEAPAPPPVEQPRGNPPPKVRPVVSRQAPPAAADPYLRQDYTPPTERPTRAPSSFAEEVPGSEVIPPPRKEKKKSGLFSAYDQDEMDIEELAPRPAPEIGSEEEIRLDIARSISASLGDSGEFEVDKESLWEDEGEPTTKRPKFNFDDLQFGKNFDSDEDE